MEGGVLGQPTTPYLLPFNRCEILEELSQKRERHHISTSDHNGISENITLPADLILSSLSLFPILLLCLCKSNEKATKTNSHYFLE